MFLYQTDSEFINEIQEYGCLFLCLAYYKYKYFHYSWTIKELNSLWQTAKEYGYINSNFEISDYVGVISLMSLPLKYLDKHSPIAVIDESKYFSITKWFNPNNDYYHFVIGIAKPVEYDPYSDSKTVREGYPVDMRLFMRMI